MKAICIMTLTAGVCHGTGAPDAKVAGARAAAVSLTAKDQANILRNVTPVKRSILKPSQIRFSENLTDVHVYSPTEPATMIIPAGTQNNSQRKRSQSEVELETEPRVKQQRLGNLRYTNVNQADVKRLPPLPEQQ